MLDTHKPLSSRRAQDDTLPQPGEEELYELVPLPNEDWQQLGEALVLPPQYKRMPRRYGKYRLYHALPGELHGLATFIGPPGTGKTVLACWAGDAAVRAHRGTGNGFLVNAANLFNEHLGRSAKRAQALFSDIALSARRTPTFVLFDDADVLFISRKQTLEKPGDPMDVAKVTTELFQGLNRLQYSTNVLMFATLNLEGVIDPAIADRSDFVLTFPLPDAQARLAILQAKIKGTAGMQVLDDLAAATEGKSGRYLSKMKFLAYLEGTCDDPEDLRKEDFLRAVGLTPADAQDVVTEEVNVEPKEEVVCTTELSTYRFLGVVLPRMNKWDWLRSWFVAQLNS
jgi:SpoVK/Ycf46/Vps4 family AAA+-type ATPase